MNSVLIYGSCTTRDSVDFWDPNYLQLTDYIARQSLISASSPGSVDGFDLEGIKSSFQRRMVKFDLLGNAITRILEHVGNGGICIWDLTDERNGAIELSTNRWVSGTAISTQGLRHNYSPVGRLFFEQPEFQDRWSKCAEMFAQLAGDRRERIFVNLTPWASKFEDGTSVPESFPTTEKFNRGLDMMGSVLENLGFPVSRIAEEEVSAAKVHQWGPAPFHYSVATYHKMIAGILNLV